MGKSPGLQVEEAEQKSCSFHLSLAFCNNTTIYTTWNQLAKALIMNIYKLPDAKSWDVHFMDMWAGRGSAVIRVALIWGTAGVTHEAWSQESTQMPCFWSQEEGDRGKEGHEG